MALGERLHDDERAALARELPSFVHAFERVTHAGDFDAAELFARVARHEAVSPGFAVEHAELVCLTLGELLPGDLMTRLRRALGSSISALFDVQPAPEPMPRSGAAGGTTLATARPGSTHPLSESNPEASRTPIATARTGTAHPVSESHAEESRTTLATGRPGSLHPVSAAKRS
jgi:hypothetical protein